MNGELLKRIARSYISRDDQSFISAMRQVISTERRQGHNQLADELGGLLSAVDISDAPPSSKSRLVRNPPVSKGESTPLIDVRFPECRLSDVVLNTETKSQINRFLEEYSRRDLLSEYGLMPIMKLLFFGPPGNGKSFCAAIIAAELGLPLFYVRFDSLVVSYLGETSSNLRKVFDFATSHTGILFFDEFDAIGKSRDDHEEIGELKRVVSSFLQLLDGYTGKSPIIAATNYEKMLDLALWRRFDSLVYFPQATRPQIEAYLRKRASSLSSHEFDPTAAALLCFGMSYSDVASTFTNSVKSMILSGKRSLSLDLFRCEVDRFRSAQEHRAMNLDTAFEGLADANTDSP